MADATAGKVKEVASDAQEMAGKVADQAREYGLQAQEAVNQVKPFVEKSLKEQPMATLASAAVLGFVLGALWKKQGRALAKACPCPNRYSAAFTIAGNSQPLPARRLPMSKCFVNDVAMRIAARVSGQNRSVVIPASHSARRRAI